MAQTVKLKRSSVAGNVPSSGQMSSGELAMNTADGKLFLKDNYLVRPIVTTGGWAPAISTPLITGSIHLTGEVRAQSLVAETFVVSSSVYYNTQSFSSGSTIFGDTKDDTHQFTGSLFISGGLTLVSSAVFNKWEPNLDLGTSYSQWSGTSSSPIYSITLGGIDVLKATKSTIDGDNLLINSSQENYDFIVKGETDDFLIKADASANKVGIGVEFPSESLHVHGNISASANIIAGEGFYGDVYTNVVSSSNTLEIHGDRIKINADNTSGNNIIVSHSLNNVNQIRSAITYTNASNTTPGSQYFNEFYTFADTGSNIGFLKGGGHSQVSASIGAAPQKITAFSNDIDTFHIEYSAVSTVGGYRELGDFYIGFSQTNLQTNQQPKILMAKNTSNPILELSSSFDEGGNIAFWGNVQSAYSPVEIIYSFTTYKHGII